MEGMSMDNDCDDVTLVLSDNKPQLIMLQGAENATYRITSNEVELRQPLSHKQNQNAQRQMASSKIKCSKIVSYDWDHKYYFGANITANRNGDFVAYTLRKAKSEGLLRVITKRNNERALLKSFHGQILDIAFAFCEETILACVDELATVYFYRVYFDSTMKIVTKLFLKISLQSPTSTTLHDTHRIVWCPYVPASEQEDDSSKVCGLTYKNELHILNLDLIVNDYDQCKTMNIDEITHGHFKVNEHEDTILHAAFSPDGQAVATASANGEVIILRNDFKFKEQPHVLTRWYPHEDKRPISSLFFLDDLTADASQKLQYWSYILTGCDYNRELKLFSCNNWKLLQTFRFTCDSNDNLPMLKTSIDLSASYIILSDINRKVFYVMHISKGQNAFEFGDLAHVDELSEFSLAYPALSFYIADRIYPRSIPSSTSNESDIVLNAELNNTSRNVLLKLYCIQTKVLQEMIISLRPSEPSFNSNGNISRLSKSISTASDLKDGLSDVLSDREDYTMLKEQLNISNSNMPQSNLAQSSGIQVNTGLLTNTVFTPVLMTPDAFSNSPRRLNDSTTSIAKSANDLIQSIMSGSTLTNITSHLSVLPTPMGQSNLLNPLQFTPVSEIEKSLMMPSPVQIKQQLQDKEGSVTPKACDRHLSSSSDETNTQSSESSIDTTDKEVEDIVQSQDEQNEDEPQKGLNKQEATSLASVSTLTNEINLNWPNPPLLNSQHRIADDNLVNELFSLIKLQQNDIEQLKKQQTNTLTMLKDYFVEPKQVSNDESVTSLIKHTTSKMEKVLKEEIKTNIQTHMAKCLEPFKEQIPQEIAEKLKTTETFIKDQISKLFKSKTILDSISLACSQSIQSAMVTSYRDTFQKVVVPSFEKSCQTMYAQINASFKKGTDEYLQELSNFSIAQKKLIEESRDPLMEQLKTMNESIQQTLSQLSGNLASTMQLQIDQNIRNSNAILQDTIISSVKAIIKEELAVSMREQQVHVTDRLIAFMRQSGTMTPAPSSAHPQTAPTPTFSEPKQKMLAYLQKAQYNDAFQTALCAADLNLLVQLCESVSPTQLFEPKPCVLQQPVLMSLIQQLSTELNTHTDLKVKYLEEALMNLDQTNALTREHIPQIMPLVITKLQQFIQAYPNLKITKSIRMLLMACQSLSR